MVKNRRSKRIALENKSVKQTGGSPAYRFHGDEGLLSQSSLDYSPLGLTRHEQNFSDHIVATSGGGRRTKRRGSKRKGSKRKGSKRRGSRRRGSRRRGSLRR